MITLNGSSFKSEIKSDVVLVDFWGIGCGPCRVLESALKNVESKLTNIKFTKIEVSDGYDLFSEYGIRSLPTLILFKDSEEIKRRSGAANEETLLQWLNL